MKISTNNVTVSTKGNDDIIDLTDLVTDKIRQSGIKEGSCLVFIAGSTAGITTIEYEPGLRKDFPLALERWAPRNMDYAHHLTWGDGNGHSHIRSSLIGTSFAFPINDGRPLLGTWQQVVLVDFDTHARKREVIVQIMGE